MEGRGLSTEEFLARAIHNLHNCDRPINTFTEKQTSEGSRYTKPVYWRDTDRVYDAQQQYTMAPEALVRLWILEQEKELWRVMREPKIPNNLRTSFPTSCPVCGHDIRHIFNEFTR